MYHYKKIRGRAKINPDKPVPKLLAIPSKEDSGAWLLTSVGTVVVYVATNSLERDEKYDPVVIVADVVI